MFISDIDFIINLLEQFEKKNFKGFYETSKKTFSFYSERSNLNYS